jgi:hypothetical protein
MPAPAAGYARRMTSQDNGQDNVQDNTQGSQDSAPGTDPDLDYEDQDAEPTMTAPQEGRPDGLTALDDSTDEDDSSS